ncbi:MAG: ABC transporter substrate-binding protein [Actinomycetota bacterium]|nr:ABC transporter substrate-binding protein [Actinomycetota bacterium]MDQ3575759.1 ABC transporter substrate-binding protein [Actinomycetota bacterium]
MPATRIVSLIPSGTDMVAQIGLAQSVVGVSHQCDHPVAKAKPVVTSSAIPMAGDGRRGTSSPADVDRAVGRAVQAGQPLYRTDHDLLTRLAPDVVLAQDVCDVCAVASDQVRGVLPPGAELVTLEATTLSGLEEDLVRLGKATGAEDQAAGALARMRAALRAVGQAVGGRPRPQVLVLEWGDPPFLGGHWVPELVELAGGTHLISSTGQASRRTTYEEIVAARPQVVVFAPCGYTLAAAREEARGLRARLSPTTELWACHATALFSRCTPRAVVDAVRLLAGILHPAVGPSPPAGLAVRLTD